MSAPLACPDWAALAAGDRDDERENARWQRATAHLDGCDRCFDAAVAAEPTLLFRRLPRQDPSEAELDSLRQGVLALRRAGTVAPPRRRAAGRFAAAAAVAVVSAAAGLFHGGTGPATPLAPPSAPSRAAVVLASRPLVEDLAPAGEAVWAEMVQLVDAEVDLLVLVGNLDV